MKALPLVRGLMSSALLVTALSTLGCDGIPIPDPIITGNPNDNSVETTNSNSNENANDNTGSPTDDGVSQPGMDGVELEALIADSSVKPVIDYDADAPSHVEARIQVTGYDPENPVAAALSYLEAYKDFYRLEEPAAQLFPIRITKDDTGEHIFFQQQMKGIIVHGAELAVHLDNGMVTSTNGHYLPDLRDLGAPAISRTYAIQIGADDAGATASDLSSLATLVYFNGRLIGHPDEQTRLVWRLTMKSDCGTGGSCATKQYFVDAMTGEIVHIEDRTQHCDKDFDINTANGTTSSTCWNSPFETADDEMYDEDGRWCGVFEGCANTTADGFMAFNNAHRVYDYYAATFGRCGWDGDDAQLEVMVHVGFNPANAQYSRGCDSLAFSNGYPVLDVFAHEYTHAVTRWTSGLGGSFQSGALNEHYSDVFAYVLDGNWQIAEGIPGGTLRDMSNPPAFGDPDHMVPASSPAGIGYQNLPGNNDSGGIHINCGIPNKATFLLTDGGSFNGFNIRGIGREKMMRLYYFVLTGRLTSNARFIDARNATVTLAREWALGNNRFGFTMQDVCSVINAYAAVGLGARDLDCDGYDDFEDSDDDGDFRPDSVDSCPSVKNPFQEDNDRDGVGDACDNDDDNDGVPDGRDGCPFNFNPDQSDRDGDGIQDACDNCPDTRKLVPGPGFELTWWADPDQTDTDHDGHGDICDEDDDNDGVRDENDNCPKTRNPDQTDLNGDGVGLVCDEAELSALDRDQEKPDLHIPVTPGECIVCGDILRWDVRTRINVVLPPLVDARIVDEMGNVAARQKRVTNLDGPVEWIFNFNPKASAFYRFPEQTQGSRFLEGVATDQNGRKVMGSTRYFLQLLPDGQMVGAQVQPFEMTVTTGFPAQ